MSATFFANNGVGWIVGTQTLDDQRLGGPVGGGDQVMSALVFKADLAFGILRED